MSQDGRTPLSFAAEEGSEEHVAIAKYLICKGADVNKEDKVHLSYLFFVIMLDERDALMIACHTFQCSPLHSSLDMDR